MLIPIINFISKQDSEAIKIPAGHYVKEESYGRKQGVQK